jgi:uncharacterized membrane protein YbaN (DUF454 family)
MLWLLVGVLALGTGIVGIVVPLLPTTPFALLAAYCFARGCQRCELWMLKHPRFGPMLHDWRSSHAVPLPIKQLAWSMMLVSSLMGLYFLPGHLRWVPGACCVVAGFWLWSLPTRR